MRKPFVVFFSVSIGCALLIVDQVIKIFFMASPYGVERFWIFGPVSMNTFLPFGIPLSHTVFWICALVLWLLCWIWFIAAHHTHERIILFFIIIAGASNLFDRIRWGGVVDYIHIAGISVINMADIVIVGAVIALVIQRLKNKK